MRPAKVGIEPGPPMNEQNPAGAADGARIVSPHLLQILRRVRRRMVGIVAEPSKIEGLGIGPSTEMKLIKNTVDKPLYWLLIVARHELARKLWKYAANLEQQGSFF